MRKLIQTLPAWLLEAPAGRRRLVVGFLYLIAVLPETAKSAAGSGAWSGHLRDHPDPEGVVQAQASPPSASPLSAGAAGGADAGEDGAGGALHPPRRLRSEDPSRDRGPVGHGPGAPPHSPIRSGSWVRSSPSSASSSRSSSSPASGSP